MYNHEDSVKSMKIIDDVVVDNCPEVESYWGTKYDRKYEKINNFSKGDKIISQKYIFFCFHIKCLYI